MTLPGETPPPVPERGSDSWRPSGPKRIIILAELLPGDLRDVDIPVVFSDAFVGRSASTRYLCGAALVVQLASCTPPLESSGVETGCLSTVTGVAALGTMYHQQSQARRASRSWGRGARWT